MVLHNVSWKLRCCSVVRPKNVRGSWPDEEPEAVQVVMTTQLA